MPMQRCKKIILIAIDTLNVDHLGCYGYNVPHTPTTPFLDTLAKGNALFQRHYATDVPTPSSFTSLFTGTRGIHHGIIGFRNKTDEFYCLTPLLAECFSRRGFRTGMISNLLYVTPWLVKGFQDIYPPGLRFQRGTAEEVTNESTKWLEAYGKGDFFLFMHYWDPHCPYTIRAPGKYKKMFSPAEYRDFAPDMKHFSDNRLFKSLYDAKHKFMNDPLAPEENLALYDAAIRYTDDNIRKLFENIDKLGIKDEVLVVITSDHGEAFGEYGFWDHYSSYRNISQLPLIFAGEGVDNTKISGYTQNVDIMPTLLEFADIKVPEGLCGKTLLPALEEKSEGSWNEIVVNSDATAVQRMYVKDDYALVHSLTRPVYDHIKKYELFNLAEDPNQIRDISLIEKDKTSEMRLSLGDLLAEELKGKPDPLQMSVYRGGWMWEGLCGCLKPSERERLLKAYPELVKILKTRVSFGL